MMNMKNKSSGQAEYVELPTGLFTAGGLWFHTTEASLREFAGPVIDRVGIEALLSQSGIWYRSADPATAFFFLVMLVLVPPLQAASLAVIFYLIWDALLSQFVFPSVIRFTGRLSSPFIQGLAYLVVLSRLGTLGHPYAVLAGLVGFVLIRWGVIRSIAGRISRRFGGSKNAIPRTDRILRSLIIQYALSLGITLPSTESYERRVLEIWNRGKRH